VYSPSIIHDRHVRLYLEAVSGHALLVLANEVGAFLLRIVRGGEEHALVAFRFLVETYAAGLEKKSMLISSDHQHLDRLYLYFGWRGGVFEICAHVGGGWRCYMPSISSYASHT